jgi:mycothiol synthase
MKEQPGLSIRPCVPGQDEELRADLYNRAHAGDENFVPLTAEDIRRWGTSPHTQHHSSFVAEFDGASAGFASAWIHAQRTDGVGTLDGPHVLPEHRRLGIGTALAHTVLADLLSRGRVTAQVRAREGADASSFLATLGFKPVRRFSRMERSLSALPRNLGESTEATVTAVELTREMIRTLVELENETFKEHFNRQPETVAGFEFAERNLAAKGIVSHISVAAIEGKPVGFISYGYDPREIAHLGRNRARLWDVGVLRPWRNRGIAKALMLAAMRHLRAEGTDEVELNVDETNVTGALHLYEHLGFALACRDLVHRRELLPTGKETR